MRDPKLENLLRSPYDDQSDRPDAMAWKAPVGAAILGALAMSAYVIFAVIAGPTEDIDTTTSVLQVQAVQATGFPQGYAPVSDDVAIRADMMRASANGTTLFVSSVTRGGDAPDSIAPVEFADWTVNSAGSEPVMLHQHAAKGVLGGIAVELGPVFDPENATLIATLPGTIEDTEDRVTLSADLPAVLSDHEIMLRDHVVVIDELVIENGWGSMRWHLEGGFAAKVEIVVTFEGVEFPLSLVPRYAAPPSFGLGTPPLPPLWGRAGEVRLVRVGESLSESTAPTAIDVAFSVSIVTEEGESIAIPVGIVVGP